MPKKPARRPRATALDKEIGRRVRTAREQADVTQVELAKAIGVSFQQLQKHEHGVDRVSAGRLVQIAEFLKLPIGTFFVGLSASPTTRTSRKRDDDELVDFIRSPDGRRIARMFLKLQNAAARSMFMKLVRSLDE